MKIKYIFCSMLLLLLTVKQSYGQLTVTVVPVDLNYSNSFPVGTPGCSFDGISFKLQVKNNQGVITDEGLDKCKVEWSIYPANQSAAPYPLPTNFNTIHATTNNSTQINFVLFENRNMNANVQAILYDRSGQTCPYGGNNYVLNKPVRYLGTPTSITGTNEISCLSQTLNYSVASVTNATSYEWVLENQSWSSSNTTNNAIINVPAGTIGSGIFIVAKRNDNICTTQSDQNTSNGGPDPFIITRPTPNTTPVISGLSLICSGATNNLSTVLQNVSGYNWVTSNGNISITSGQGSNSITYTASQSGNVGNIQVAGTNSCGSGPYSSQKAIFSGTPTINNATVDGQSLQIPNYVNGSGTMLISATGTDNGGAWSILNGTGNIYPNGLSCQGNPNDFIRVYGQATNECGGGEARTFYLQKEGTSMYRMASANPSDGIINVELVDPIIGEDLLKEAYIISENQKEKFVFDIEKSKRDKYFEKNKSFQIDISKGSKGTMYLKMRVGDKEFTERILKN